jgi:hypothetical protein
MKVKFRLLEGMTLCSFSGAETFFVDHIYSGILLDNDLYVRSFDGMPFLVCCKYIIHEFIS